MYKTIQSPTPFSVLKSHSAWILICLYPILLGSAVRYRRRRAKSAANLKTENRNMTVDPSKQSHSIAGINIQHNLKRNNSLKGGPWSAVLFAPMPH